MHLLTVAALALAMLLVSQPPAAAVEPQAVSPGAADRAAATSRCPTFSWGYAALGGRGFDLAVFAVGADGVLAAEPTLRQRIAPGAASWTPASDRCLPTGSYAWTIRALGNDDEAAWSDSRFFTVAESGLTADLERAVERVLERWLAQGKLAGGLPASGDLRRLIADDPSATVPPLIPPESGPTGGSPSFVVDAALFDPPDCVNGGEMFSDVDDADSRCQFIEQFANDQISTGCGPDPDGGGPLKPRFCPDDPITRGQLAVFMERGIRGTTVWGANSHNHFAQFWSGNDFNPGLYILNSGGGIALGGMAPSRGVVGISSGGGVGAFGVMGVAAPNDPDVVPVPGPTGVYGRTGTGTGVRGDSVSGVGVYGASGSSYGVFARSGIDHALRALSDGTVAAADLENSNASGPALYAKGEFDAAASFATHVVQFENAAETNVNGPDVLAIKTSANNPTVAANLITFFDADGAIGRIEGDGLGGITLGSGGADYAEWLPKLDTNEPLSAGDVVGLYGDRVSRRTDGALRLMAVSSGPIVAGNDPGDEQRSEYALVAFVGQVPVRVRGAARVGDVIVASGQDDGSARAVSPENLTAADAERILGRALEAKPAIAPGKVRTLVGLPDFALITARESTLLAEIADLRARLAILEDASERRQPDVAALP